MKMCGGVDVYIHILLTSTLVGGESPASRPGRFTPGTPCIGSRVEPKAGLHVFENRKFLTLPGLELRPLDRPDRGQSLYRLRYPDSHNSNGMKSNRQVMSRNDVEEVICDMFQGTISEFICRV
jgi:hypothetical protein